MISGQIRSRGRVSFEITATTIATTTREEWIQFLRDLVRRGWLPGEGPVYLSIGTHFVQQMVEVDIDWQSGHGKPALHLSAFVAPDGSVSPCVIPVGEL